MTLSINNDINLIAKCGLYCGTCKKLLSGKCPGCKESTKASWCKIRTCTIENNYDNCSQCAKINLEDCKKLNNFIGKAFSLVFKTDRLASLTYIKNNGAELFAAKMCELNQMSIKRNQNI